MGNLSHTLVAGLLCNKHLLFPTTLPIRVLMHEAIQYQHCFTLVWYWLCTLRMLHNNCAHVCMQPNGKAKMYIATLGVLAPYRGYSVGAHGLRRQLPRMDMRFMKVGVTVL